MKKLLLITSMIFAFISLSACSHTDSEPVVPDMFGQKENQGNKNPNVTSLKMNIIVGERTISATMEDNAAARDLLSRLPIEVTLDDYNNTTEKIFYPDPKLELDGVTRGCTPEPGDITIYEPWGNVAIFCKSWSQSNDLIKIGHIDGNGIEALTVPGDVTVRLERTE